MYEKVIKELLALAIENLMKDPPDLAEAEYQVRFMRDLAGRSATRIGQLEPVAGAAMAVPGMAVPYRPPPAERAMSELVEAAHSFTQPRPPTLTELVNAYEDLCGFWPEIAGRVRTLLERTVSRLEAEGEKQEEILNEGIHSELPG